VSHKRLKWISSGTCEEGWIMQEELRQVVGRSVHALWSCVCREEKRTFAETNLVDSRPRKIRIDIDEDCGPW
jgi:hypothetical protein